MRVEGEGYDVVCMILFEVPVALRVIFCSRLHLFLRGEGVGAK